jgi:hypothetical protein
VVEHLRRDLVRLVKRAQPQLVGGRVPRCTVTGQRAQPMRVVVLLAVRHLRDLFAELVNQCQWCGDAVCRHAHQRAVSGTHGADRHLEPEIADALRDGRGLEPALVCYLIDAGGDALAHRTAVVRPIRDQRDLEAATAVALENSAAAWDYRRKAERGA